MAKKSASKKKAPEKRAGSGQFQRGQSGNPGGRPKAQHRLKELAQDRTEEALDVLVEIMNNKDAPHTSRVSAASAILDRGYGRPAQALTGEDGGPLTVQIVRFGDDTTSGE